MAKKTKDELLASAKAILGDNTSDEALTFMEDISDSLEVSTEDWEAKYKENDAAWRKRYAERFMSSGGDSDLEPEPDDEPKRMTYEELFKEE